MTTTSKHLAACPQMTQTPRQEMHQAMTVMGPQGDPIHPKYKIPMSQLTPEQLLESLTEQTKKRRQAMAKLRAEHRAQTKIRNKEIDSLMTLEPEQILQEMEKTLTETPNQTPVPETKPKKTSTKTTRAKTPKLKTTMTESQEKKNLETQTTPAHRARMLESLE
jgi:restriction endonuclease S subunit